jgi:hypothetical protein
MPTPADPAAGEEHPRKNSRVMDELLADGSMVLFHTASRQLMTLNPTAALIWEYCDGTHTETSITSELLALFPDAPTVAGDVNAVLRDLRARGMLSHER